MYVPKVTPTLVFHVQLYDGIRYALDRVRTKLIALTNTTLCMYAVNWLDITSLARDIF